jgi:hypothetical protein
VLSVKFLAKIQKRVEIGCRMQGRESGVLIMAQRRDGFEGNVSVSREGVSVLKSE